jgi:GT2 family glycosyltransferase
VAVPATIIIPTRGRPDYLAVTLSSLAAQAREAGAEVIVVDDGRDARCERVARESGARYLALGSPRGANAARNAGIAGARGQLLIFTDDDIEADPGWLERYLRAARELPDVDVFGGPIRARLEGRRRRRVCGRESPPVTHTDLGAEDRDMDHARSANLAVRASAFERLGGFDESYAQAGEEEEWEDRYVAAGGRIRYVAGAGVDHRRTAEDARLLALGRVAVRRGYWSRRYDERKGAAPGIGRELRVLAGCVAHGPRRRCWNGPLLAAHSLGRVTAALTRARSTAPGDPDHDFLSGESGTIGGKRDLLRELGDIVLDLLSLRARAALRRAARRDPPRRRVLVVSVARREHRATYDRAVAELRRSRHDVTIAERAAGDLGRFENLNLLLAERRIELFDWLLLLDDDVVLPRGFLDGLLNQAERLDLRLVQPAHRLRSHAAWRVTRRRAFSVVRETAFVEIGPVTALAQQTFADLVPFPPLRMGWGLDAHWSALARERGWRIGVVDVLPIAHRAAAAATVYSRDAAVAEASAFLAAHPYLPATELQRTLVVHRRCA